jgi:hypothetical protein
VDIGTIFTATALRSSVSHPRQTTPILPHPRGRSSLMRSPGSSGWGRGRDLWSPVRGRGSRDEPGIASIAPDGCKTHAAGIRRIRGKRAARRKQAPGRCVLDIPNRIARQAWTVRRRGPMVHGRGRHGATETPATPRGASAGRVESVGRHVEARAA